MRSRFGVGLSGMLGRGDGEEVLSIDLMELFLSKDLGLDAVRGLLKVGTYAF